MKSDDGAPVFRSAFSDRQAIARYTEGLQRYVPGFESLFRMAGVLLAERAAWDATVLVLGVGGGLELKALADMQSGWRFVGVDPAMEMLKLAERTLGPQLPRVQLVKGRFESAPQGPFDAAACLLSLHFLAPDDRRRTLIDLRDRLKPGAPLVVAHGSYPQGISERARWLTRYAAYAVAAGADAKEAERTRAAVDAHVPMLTPEQDETILQEAGFKEVTLFFAAFTWRGWVSYA
ncbi:MAG: class I SAM-dependent methyltransferase [Steroidobacteraceae bacterium]